MDLPHWDLDANAVRSEYTTWIRNNCRHFDKLPLEPGMVHWDSIRSSRSTTTSSRSIRHSTSHHSSSSDDPSNKDGKKDKKADKKREKQEKEDRKKQEKLDKAEKKKQQKLAGKQGAGSLVPGAGQDSTQIGSEAPPAQKVVSNPANAEPEAIQDLEGLRRQQEMSKQKAIEKRREYNLEPPLPPTSEDAPAVAGPVLDEQQQQQAGQLPPESPVPPLGDQQQRQHPQGVIPTVITELCSPTTLILPQRIPLPNSSQSSLSSQHDPAGLPTTISHPVVKEQTEMEKSLEAIAQTLSRHNSLNHLPTATTSITAGISGSVSMPALGEATVMSGVEPAVDTTYTSVVAVDAQDAPTAVTSPSPLLEEFHISTVHQRPSTTITNTENNTETMATMQAEEIIPQEQEQEQGREDTNTLNPIVHVDDSLPEVPSSSPSIQEETPEQVAPAESPISPKLVTSLPGQFFTSTATAASTIEEAPIDSKIVDDIIA
ncbi:hypothetical protein K457DRAFT_25501 [Linnemannia elongata AG-77]|uniref:Uncharacterized protein n=1 Tax=Linnemannia elongata AG-77 TaxID=1314771 RepID=A0A197JEU5_9FUNG|nr:hypothetical protein K457DRAFT_25501 [Linnemannia elongata AG-77]